MGDMACVEPDQEISVSQRKLRRSSVALAGIKKGGDNSLESSFAFEANPPSPLKQKSKSFNLFGLFSSSSKKIDSESDLLKLKCDSFSTFSTDECSTNFSNSFSSDLSQNNLAGLSLGSVSPTELLNNGYNYSTNNSPNNTVISRMNRSDSQQNIFPKSTPDIKNRKSISLLRFSSGNIDNKSTQNSPLNRSNSSSGINSNKSEANEEINNSTRVMPQKRMSMSAANNPANKNKSTPTSPAQNENKHLFRNPITLLSANHQRKHSEDRGGSNIDSSNDLNNIHSNNQASDNTHNNSDHNSNQNDDQNDKNNISENDNITVLKTPDGRRLSIKAVTPNAPPAPLPPATPPAKQLEHDMLASPNSTVPFIAATVSSDGTELSPQSQMRVKLSLWERITDHEQPEDENIQLEPELASPQVFETNSSTGSIASPTSTNANNRPLSKRKSFLNKNKPKSITLSSPTTEHNNSNSNISTSVRSDSIDSVKESDKMFAHDPASPANSCHKRLENSSNDKSVGAKRVSFSPPAASSAEQEVENVTVVKTPDGRRLSIKAVTPNAPPAPLPPIIRDSSRGNADTDASPNRESKRVSFSNTPPPPATSPAPQRGAALPPPPPTIVRSVPAPPAAPASEENITVLKTPDGRRLSIKAVTPNAPPAPLPPRTLPTK